jgi:hypothetical protein
LIELNITSASLDALLFFTLKTSVFILAFRIFQSPFPHSFLFGLLQSRRCFSALATLTHSQAGRPLKAVARLG